MDFCHCGYLLKRSEVTKKILITGASGFVGARLLERCVIDGLAVSTITRPGCRNIPHVAAHYVTRGLEFADDLSDPLRGQDVVVHCAARVHVMNEHAINPLVEFQRINVAGTLHLAQQAAAAGVKRFIYLSSVKVNGEETFGGSRFTAKDSGRPTDAYAISKDEAEIGLRSLALLSGLEVVIIRPPLVYGAKVQGNFKTMLSAIYSGIPLPFAAIHNKKSFVALDNLVDLLLCCVVHPAAANQTLMVSDDDDISTPELLRHVGLLMGRPARLFAAPKMLLHGVAAMAGHSAAVSRLVGSLQVDISDTRRLLNWTPVVTVKQGLLQAVEGYFVEKSI